MSIRDLVAPQYQMPTVEEMGQGAFEPSPELLAEAQQAVAEGQGEQVPADLGMGSYRDIVDQWGASDTNMGGLTEAYQPTGIGKLLAERGRKWEGGAASPLMSFAGKVMDAVEQRRVMENRNIVSFAKKQLMDKVEKIYTKLVDGNPDNDEKAIRELRKLGTNAYMQFNTDFGINKVLDGFVANKQKEDAINAENQRAALNAQVKMNIENQKAEIQRARIKFNESKLSQLPPQARLNALVKLATAWGVPEGEQEVYQKQAEALINSTGLQPTEDTQGQLGQTGKVQNTNLKPVSEMTDEEIKAERAERIRMKEER